jgi:PH (Pleckstrin Homology) domain-containing protein
MAVNPKHLGRFLAEGEVLYVETRATKLFYFPLPIFSLLIVLFLDYVGYAAVHSTLGIPGFQQAFGAVPASVLPYVLDFFVFLTVIVLLWLLVAYIRWWRTVYAVSNHRIIIKRGIVGRDIDDIPMNQIRGVDVHQTIGQRALGYGTVRVSAESGTARSIGNEDWEGIPKPFQVQRTIETVMQNPVMPAAVMYPQQPAVVYSGPPPYQPPPSSPPR